MGQRGDQGKSSAKVDPWRSGGKGGIIHTEKNYDHKKVPKGAQWRGEQGHKPAPKSETPEFGRERIID